MDLERSLGEKEMNNDTEKQKSYPGTVARVVEISERDILK
jgi:hypothetical protein